MPTTQNIQEIIRNIRAGADPSAALEAICKHLDATDLTPADRSLLLAEKGKILWKSGERAGAISAYEEGARLSPDGPAAMLLEHSRGIMDFFNPDLLNP